MEKQNIRKRVLLISSSTLYGSGYLDHAESEIRALLGDIREILFIPYALFNRDAYASGVCDRARKMGFACRSIHSEVDPQAAVREAQSIFIGGGNTFRLLKTLYDLELLTILRSRVADGMPYIGTSAGSNVACPTIKTTNDMPIVQPPHFDALGLVLFQINPHYLDADPASTHRGETREERILQFLEENETPVVGLREGAMVLVENETTLLKGVSGARVFRKGHKPVEANPGEYLDHLLWGPGAD